MPIRFPPALRDPRAHLLTRDPYAVAPAGGPFDSPEGDLLGSSESTSGGRAQLAVGQMARLISLRAPDNRRPQLITLQCECRLQGNIVPANATHRPRFVVDWGTGNSQNHVEFDGRRGNTLQLVADTVSVDARLDSQTGIGPNVWMGACAGYGGGGNPSRLTWTSYPEAIVSGARGVLHPIQDHASRLKIETDIDPQIAQSPYARVAYYNDDGTTVMMQKMLDNGEWFEVPGGAEYVDVTNMGGPLVATNFIFIWEIGI